MLLPGFDNYLFGFLDNWYCILYLQSMQVSLKGALCWTV